MPSTPAPPEPPRDPIAEAAQHYDMGLRNRDKAWKLEEQLAAAPEADRAKLEKKIGKQYKRATNEFRMATSKNPQMFEAWSDLGYTLRKIGKYDDALVAYGNSLSLAPGYGKAIEYRAVAYLGLNRLDEAKESYIQLFGSDREEAAKLMEEMKSWVEARRESPGDIDGSTVDGFAEWVSEREGLAGKTAHPSAVLSLVNATLVLAASCLCHASLLC